MKLSSKLGELARILEGHRGTGRTTALVNAAKQIGATYLVTHSGQRKYVDNQHNIKSKVVSTSLRGIRGPFILDHLTTSTLLLEAANEIHALESKIDNIEYNKLSSDIALDRAEKLINFYKNESILNKIIRKIKGL